MTRCVFICSAGHSGSTLLDLMLGTHSRIESLGELTHLSKNLALNTECSCGKPVLECDAWTHPLQELADKHHVDYRNNPYQLHIGYPVAHTVIDPAHQTRMYLMKRTLLMGARYLQLAYRIPFASLVTWPVIRTLNRTLEIYDAVGKYRDADVVVDSSKEYIKAVGLYRLHPEKMKIVLLTRDGRGVFYSKIRRGFDPKTSLDGWVHYYQRALGLMEKYVPAEAVLTVRYEDLANDTAQEIRRITEFTGLDYEPAMLDISTKVHHLANGNDLRMARNIEIRIDDKWRTELTSDQLEYFEKRAGVINRALGYKD